MISEQAVWWVLLIVGVGGSALCSGLEIGFYSINRVRLQIRAADSKDTRAALLAVEAMHPDATLATLLVANNLFNYLGTLGLTGLVAGLGFSEPKVIVITALVFTPVIVILGESLPKELFRVHADRWMYPLAPVLRASRLFLTAVGVLPSVLWFSRAAARLTGARPGSGLHRSGRQRMVSLLRESAGIGLLSSSQATLVDRAMAFGARRVGDEFVPWSTVACISAEWDRSRLIRFLKTHKHTRFPVVDRRRRVVGVLRNLDVHLYPDRSLADLALDPIVIGPAESLEHALLELRSGGTGLAIVGSLERPDGIVTTKDLVEPITGELAAW